MNGKTAKMLRRIAESITPDVDLTGYSVVENTTRVRKFKMNALDPMEKPSEFRTATLRCIPNSGRSIYRVIKRNHKALG